MGEPIVFVSRNRVDPAATERLQGGFASFVDLIRATKPRTSLFAAYLRDDELRVMHAFADAAAMAEHFEGAAQRSAAAAALIRPAGFELYGDAAPPQLEQLRRDANDAGVSLEVFPVSLGGFLRGPA